MLMYWKSELEIWLSSWPIDPVSENKLKITHTISNTNKVQIIRFDDNKTPVKYSKNGKIRIAVFYRAE